MSHAGMACALTFLILSTPFLPSRKCAYSEWAQYYAERYKLEIAKSVKQGFCGCFTFV